MPEDDPLDRGRPSKPRGAVALGGLVVTTSDTRLLRFSSQAVIRLPLETCGLCARPTDAHVFVSRGPRASLHSVPRVVVPACSSCARSLRRALLFEFAEAALVFAAGFVGAGIAALAWRWIPLAALVVVALTTSLVTSLLLRFRVARDGISPRLLPHLAVRWVRSAPHEAVLEVRSSLLAQALLDRGGQDTGETSVGDARRLWAVAAAVLCGLIAPWVLRATLTGSVRVAHVATAPVEVLVDGRSVGVVVGVEREDPAAIEEVRVPIGWRVFEARAMDGTVVDRTTAYVGGTGAELYVPVRGAQCFWVEQQGYGRAAGKVLRTEPSPSHGGWVTVPDPVDSWFEVNPSVDAGGRWFSGGFRRTMRHGPCAGPP